MSWMSYVEMLVKDGCQDAALIDIQTGVAWAQTETFNIQETEGIEAAKILKGLSDDIDCDSTTRKVTNAGIRFGGKSYVFIKAHGRSMYGKLGRAGIIVSASERLLIVGTFPESEWPHTIAHSVGKLAAYLESLSY